MPNFICLFVVTALNLFKLIRNYAVRTHVMVDIEQ